MARYDSIVPYAKDFEPTLDDTSWATILSFDIKKDDYSSVKLWAEIKRVAGAGTVELRFQLTDGVTPHNSTGLSSTSTSYDPVGPDEIDMTSLADQIWTCNVQGQVPSGAKMQVRGVYIQRYRA